VRNLLMENLIWYTKIDRQYGGISGNYFVSISAMYVVPLC